MKNLSALILLTALAACSHSPTAPGAKRGVASTSCLETAMSQLEINECANSIAQASDDALNHVWDCIVVTQRQRDARRYAAILENRRGQRPGFLRETQRAWSQYKANSCSYEMFESVHGEGGSILPSLVAGCVMSQTKSRLQELVYTSEALGLGCESNTNYRYTKDNVTRNVNIAAELQALGIESQLF